MHAVAVAGLQALAGNRPLKLHGQVPHLDVERHGAPLAPAAVSGLGSLPRFTEKPLATRLYDEAAPRVLSRRRWLVISILAVVLAIAGGLIAWKINRSRKTVALVKSAETES